MSVDRPTPYNDDIGRLTKDAKKLLQAFNGHLENNREDDFFEENKDKNICIMLESGEEQTGKLMDIDKFRLIIEQDGKPFYIFKHSVVGYYVL
jgi:sRNA-binding regulator protein Hfq